MVPQTGYESSCLAGGIDNESFRFGHAETVLEKGYKKERGFARGGLAKGYSIQQRCIYEIAHRGHEGRIIG